MSRWKFSKLGTLLVLAATTLLFWSNTALAQEQVQPDGVEEPGVLILSVEAESPAAEAGLRRGDIVLRVDDQQINDAMALRTAIRELAPEDTITLAVLHGDDERQLEVTLGENDGLAFLGIVPYSAPTVEVREHFGMMQEEMLQERILEHAPFPAAPPAAPMAPRRESMEGVTVTLVVVDVAEESAAAAAGLQPDDVISAINGTAPTTAEALAESIGALSPDDTITLTVQSMDEGAGARDVVVTLGAHPDDAERAYLGVQLAAMIHVEREGGDFTIEGLPAHRFQFRKQEDEFAPGEHFLRGFQLPMPPVMPHLFNWHEECHCGVDAPQQRFFMPGQQFMPGGPHNFTMPAPRGFFWMEDTPVDEGVFIQRGVPAQFDFSTEPIWEDEDMYFTMPGSAQPAVPAEPLPVQVEIVGESI